MAYYHREKTRKVRIGKLLLGGSNEIIIQSMCAIKTSHTKEVIAQINQCVKLGAKLMRVSILDKEDALAIKEIKKHITVPLIGDIHFDPALAILAIDNGIDKIRLNPGNISEKDAIIKIIQKAKEKNVAIRVGVNSGSLDREILDKYHNEITALGLVESAKKLIDLLEANDFHDIVISLKGSDVQKTIAAYRLAAKTFPYPLHLGLTEASIKDIGLIRSSLALGPLLLEGIGNTIRISLTDEPFEEVLAAKRMLKDLNLITDFPTLISCPTCGRTEVNLIPLAKQVNDFLIENNIPLTVAIMGCVVNGPGEAKQADIGIAGGKKQYVIFKKGQILKTVKESEAFATLKAEILKML